jgi:hypothetical protein
MGLAVPLYSLVSCSLPFAPEAGCCKERRRSTIRNVARESSFAVFLKIMSGFHFENVTLTITPKVNRPWLFERLKNSLQLLAIPSDVKPGQFPDFVHAADEITSEFNHLRMAFAGSF